jgi:hypothetical protein
MSKGERQEILDKYEGSSISVSSSESSIWDKYKSVLKAFQENKVNYHQMKNGIFKVIKEDFLSSGSQEGTV